MKKSDLCAGWGNSRSDFSLYQNLYHTHVQGDYGGEERCVTGEMCGRRQQEVGTMILESGFGEAGCAMGQ